MERADASLEMFLFALNFCKTVLSKCVEWFTMIYDATGMTSLWIGGVALASVFSILVLRLRSGQNLSSGAIGSFVISRVNRHKANKE